MGSCLFGTLRLAENCSHARLTVAARARAFLVLLVVHLHRLEVVRQLEVDSALGRRQREHADVLDGRDLVDFGDVLAHKAAPAPAVTRAVACLNCRRSCAALTVAYRGNRALVFERACY